MSYVTWGVNALKEASVFCNHCRAVFAQHIPLSQAHETAQEAAVNHHCTPAPRWKPKEPT